MIRRPDQIRTRRSSWLISAILAVPFFVGFVIGAAALDVGQPQASGIVTAVATSAFSQDSPAPRVDQCATVCTDGDGGTTSDCHPLVAPAMLVLAEPQVVTIPARPSPQVELASIAAHEVCLTQISISRT